MRRRTPALSWISAVVAKEDLARPADGAHIFMLAGNPLWLKWSRGKLKISRDRVPLCFSSASRERDLKWPRSHLKRLSTESNQRRFYLREGTTVALVINLKSVFILFRASVIFRAQLFLKLRSFNKVALVPLTFSRLTLPGFFFLFFLLSRS